MKMKKIVISIGLALLLLVAIAPAVDACNQNNTHNRHNSHNEVQLEHIYVYISKNDTGTRWQNKTLNDTIKDLKHKYGSIVEVQYIEGNNAARYIYGVTKTPTIVIVPVQTLGPGQYPVHTDIHGYHYFEYVEHVIKQMNV